MEDQGFDSQQGQDILPFYETYRPALGTSQLPIQSVME
jgi:hypothetical protein